MYQLTIKFEHAGGQAVAKLLCTTDDEVEDRLVSPGEADIAFSTSMVADCCSIRSPNSLLRRASAGLADPAFGFVAMFPPGWLLASGSDANPSSHPNPSLTRTCKQAICAQFCPACVVVRPRKSYIQALSELLD